MIKTAFDKAIARKLENNNRILNEMLERDRKNYVPSSKWMSEKLADSPELKQLWDKQH